MLSQKEVVEHIDFVNSLLEELNSLVEAGDTDKTAEQSQKVSSEIKRLFELPPEQLAQEQTSLLSLQTKFQQVLQFTTKTKADLSDQLSSLQTGKKAVTAYNSSTGQAKF